MKQKNRNHLFFLAGLLLFGLLTYFPVFLHLDTLPIRIYDEARYAVNAEEMARPGNNFLITHYEGKPDMWNTKPPLLIWLQVFFIKLFGVGELAVRLPSAMAAFLTAAVLMLFSLRYLKDYWMGLIAVLILITSNGYINAHAARTGDCDSLLTLFTTVYLLSVFLFTETENKSYLHLFFLAFTLAIMSKGVQGALFLPGLLIWLLLAGKLRLFLNKWFLIDMLLSALVIGGYYLGREHYNPGYLKAVWENELGVRYMTTLENNKQDFMFYFNTLVRDHFKTWYLLIPVGIVMGILVREKRIKRISLYSALIIVSYWLIISISKTKLVWYEVPMFPLLALIAAIPVYLVFMFLKKSSIITRVLRFNFLPYAFLFMIFLFPYAKIIDKVFLPEEYEWDKHLYRESYFLQDAVDGKKSLDGRELCYRGYNAQLLFYANILEDRGEQVVFRDWTCLEAGDRVLASQPIVKEYIRQNYTSDSTVIDHNLVEYSILESGNGR
jgi:4-amino-4-deoxy-L-arabinose transferase-like glycosyltransferase